MTATEYFNKLLGYEEHRRELLERVNELELLATSTGAIRTDKERVKSSPSNKQEDLIIQLVDMANTYSQALHKANVMWMEADERISKLDKYERRMVLRYRYMASKPKRMQWIADEMGYSVDRIKHIHREALEEFERRFLND